MKIYIFWKFWNFITPLPIIINIYWTPSLPMVFWPPSPWYINPPTHGISTPYPWQYWPPYPWYINPHTHGILTPQPMVFWPPCPWNIDPPLPMVYQTLSYGIMNSFLLVEMRGGGVQFTMRGFKIYSLSECYM